MSSYKRPFSQTQLREKNLSAILYALKAHEPAARAQLAELTALNKSTVSSLIDELQTGGMIQEVGTAESGGGRPRRLLELNRSNGVVVGVEFGTRFVSAVLTNLGGKIVARTRAEIDPENIEQAMQTAVSQIKSLLSAYTSSAVLGIGVALAGIIDQENGRLIYSPNTKWRQVPVRQLLTDAFALPVYIENNANAAALGEYFFGAAQLVENFIFVSIGQGIGSGLFLNGQLIRGVSGLSGEIGQSHVLHGEQWLATKDEQGRQRWDVFANKDALIRLVKQATQSESETAVNSPLSQQDEISLQAIAAAAKASDPLALNCLKHVGERIGLGLANLTHLLDPALILIGGELVVVAPYLMPHINRVVQASDSIERPFPTEINISTFGTDAIVVGASTLVIKQIMDYPKQFIRL